MHLVKRWIHSFHLLILQMEFEIVTFPDLGLQLTVRVFNSFKSTQNHNKTYVSCTGMYTFQQNASLLRVFIRKKEKWKGLAPSLNTGNTFEDALLEILKGVFQHHRIHLEDCYHRLLQALLYG